MGRICFDAGMAPVRVLNVVSVLSSREGGGNAERTAQLSRALIANGVECSVLTLDIGDPIDRLPCLTGASIEVLPCLSQRFQIPRWGWPAIRCAVQNADVIHLMGYWSILGAMVCVAALRHKIPYVVCPAGALPIFGRSRWLKKLFNLLIGNKVIRQASAWVAITQAEVPQFAAYGISADLVKVIPNGVWDSDFVVGDGQEFRKEILLTSQPFILFVGRLNSIKGPDLLLDAFVRIAPDFPGVHLVFAGLDEGLGGILKQEVKSVGLSDRVNFCGFIGGSLKVSAYKAASLLVVPSRSEAMSIVAVEAGICGTPVLMTDQCGLDELAEVNRGLIVPATVDGLADGLKFALENHERLAGWGAEWRSIVCRRFLWRDIGQQFKGLLEQVANKRVH